MRCQDGKAASNWVTQDVLRVLKERNLSIAELPVSSATIADLIARIKSGELPSPRARDVFQAMVDTGVDVGQAMSALGIDSVDDSELVALCERIVAANPKIAADVRGGKDAGDRGTCRTGKEIESQRRPQSSPRNLLAADWHRLVVTEFTRTDRAWWRAQ